MQENLNRENIFKYLGEEQIFERYLGIPVLFGKRFRNPLRNDEHADCQFYEGYKKIFFRDHAMPEFNGDCFQIAALANGLNLPGDFYQVLRIINRDFKLSLFDGYLDSIVSLPISRPEIVKDLVKTIKEKAKISVIARKFTPLDLAYWKQFGITEDILKKFNVYRAKEVWINDSRYYHFDYNDLCYAYHFVEDNTFKIYKPFEKRELKWRCNSTIVQGMSQIIKGGNLIITKSMKDIMTLYSVGFKSIASQAEGIGFSSNTVSFIKNSFEDKVVFYDNDEAGLLNALRISPILNCNSIILPEESGVKDSAECYKKYGEEFLRNFILSETQWIEKLKN